MSSSTSSSANHEQFVHALYSFVAEFGAQRELCVANREKTAIHAKGKDLQVYRMYSTDAEAISYLRGAAESLPPWDEAMLFDWEGDKWDVAKKQIDIRVQKHKKLQEVTSRGVCWKGNAVCIHAYKFEPDPMFKVELVMPSSQAKRPELALRTLADSLECHDFLLPEEVATAASPYARHEAAFMTIDEYLSRNLPPDMYDLYAHDLSVQSSSEPPPPRPP